MKRNQLLTLLIGAGVVSALVASLFMGGCVPGPRVEEEKVIKIADNFPFSGAYAGWGWMNHVSMMIFADDVNTAGGIMVGGESYRVEIPIYDNKMDPTVALSVARRSIFDDKVIAIQSGSTDQSVAINELCNTEKVISLACSGTMGDYMGPDFPYTFQHYYEWFEPHDVAMRYAREVYPEWTRIAAISPDDLRGHDAARDYERATALLGFDNVGVWYVAPEEMDFYSVLTPMLAEGIDFIDITTLGYAQEGPLVKQARELGFVGVFLFPDTIDTPVVAEVCGMEALEGTISAPMICEMPTPLGKEWAEKYVAAYGSLQMWTAYSYDVNLLLKAAIEEVDSLDTEKIIEALGEVEVNGLLGPVSYATTDFTHGLPRYLKMFTPCIQIINGELVDVYVGYSTLWD